MVGGVEKSKGADAKFTHLQMRFLCFFEAG